MSLLLLFPNYNNFTQLIKLHMVAIFPDFLDSLLNPTNIDYPLKVLNQIQNTGYLEGGIELTRVPINLY